LVST
jgi:Retrotransposon gag protein